MGGYGSAQWGHPLDSLVVDAPTGLLAGAEPFRDVGWKRLMINTWPTGQNALVLGPPRSGKGARFFVPNLLSLPMQNYAPNVVVSDPKAELLGLTWRYLIEAGYRYVYAIAFGQPQRSYAFDPLSPDSESAVTLTSVDLQAFARAIVPDRQEREPFWANMARTVFSIAGGLVQRLAAPQQISANFGEAMAIATALLSDKDLLAAVQAYFKKFPDPWLATQLQSLIDAMAADQRIAGNIGVDLLSRYSNLITPEAMQVTTGPDPLRWLDLIAWGKDHPWVVFIQASPETAQLSALTITSLLQTLRNVQRNTNRLTRPLWILLDEFANLGPIPNIAEALTILPGLGVSTVLGLQALSQLDTVYGRNEAKTLRDAAHYWIVYPGLGPESAKAVSERLGTTTAWDANGFDKIGRPNLSSHARHLLTADEVARLGSDEVIVHRTDRHPVQITSIPYYSQARWQGPARIGLPDDPQIAEELAAWQTNPYLLKPETVTPTLLELRHTLLEQLRRAVVVPPQKPEEDNASKSTGPQDLGEIL